MPTLTGTGEPRTVITVSIDGTASTVTATVQPDGTWSWTSPTALPDTPHVITVTSSDAAGNTSGTSTTNVTVDTDAPAAPVVTALAIEGTPITGTAEAGSLVIITGPGPGGTTIELGRGIAVGGNFSIALSPAQTNETTLTVRATDAAGNLSDPTTFNVVDAPDLPDVPVITSIADNNGTDSIEVKGGVPTTPRRLSAEQVRKTVPSPCI